MPTLFSIGTIKVFFWSNEAGEPIHVHACVGVPQKVSTKFWLTEDRHCEVASNGSRFSNKDLRELTEVLEAQYDMIVDAWKAYFHEETVRYYK